MMKLAPQFSSNRMVQEYVEKLYHPAAMAYQKRSAQQGQLAKQLVSWNNALILHWPQIRFGNIEVAKTNKGWSYQLQVYLGEILPEQVRVELYADALGDGITGAEAYQIIECQCQEKISGALNGYCYQADIETTRAAKEFTPRVVPYHAEARIPAEENLILWQS